MKKRSNAYRIYSNRRRGVYFIFRDPAAAFIRGRRLFGEAFIQKSLYSVLNIVLQMVTFLLGNSSKSQYINVVHFVCSIVKRKREVSLVVPAKFSALTAELRVAKILERELNTRAKKYSHFELKNVVLKENKFPLLV